jgi:hypothetical protein
MAINMKENGKMARNMEKEFIRAPTAMFMKGSIKMGRNMGKATFN